jgi:hypothetical protein
LSTFEAILSGSNFISNLKKKLPLKIAFSFLTEIDFFRTFILIYLNLGKKERFALKLASRFGSIKEPIKKKQNNNNNFFYVWLKKSKRTMENTDFSTVLDKFDYYLLTIVEFRPRAVKNTFCAVNLTTF